MDLPCIETTDSPGQTEELGQRFAAIVGAGDRIVVSGDLGAGKTAFIRGCCRGLGVTSPVTSPTFTIARRYEEGRVPVSHLDLYRLEEGFSGEDPGLLEEEFGSGRVTFVEWPERAPAEWLDPAHTVTIEHLDRSTRRVTVS